MSENTKAPEGSFTTDGRTAIIKIKPDAEIKLNLQMNKVTNLEALDAVNGIVKHLSEMVIADAKAAGYPNTAEGLDAYMAKMRKPQ